MKKMTLINTAVVLAVMSMSVSAYDGQNCSEPGVCWEPKPGYPGKVAGSKYDPKHDVNELNKQAQSIVEMEARNTKRQINLAKTGKFVYDVEDIE
jgi:methanol dehydrogenase (cytochrome c) subunit 2